MNFEKQYTDDDYANKACEANATGQMLYVLVTEEAYAVEIPVTEIVQQEQSQIKLDENGSVILDSEGNPVTETITVEIEQPVMVEKEVPMYDGNGEPVMDEVGKQVVEIIEVPATRTEERTKKVGNLVLAEPDYYVCYEANYTDGTINENLEAEKAQKERERLAMLTLTAADVERAVYKVRGMDFDDVIAVVVAKSQAMGGVPDGIDVKALKIELKANNFYRGNPYIEKVGQLLGFTSEKLDKFFETKDAEELR